MKFVLVVASRKGGAGKSTLAQVTAEVLAKDGQSVTIIDADPNKPQARWKSGNTKQNITVIDDVSESTIVKHIDAVESGFVIVDLEGIGSRLVARSIARADLVVIPIQASGLDAVEAGNTIALITEEEELLRRKIPYKLVLTRTGVAIPSRIEKQMVTELSEAGINVMKNQLNERAAFKSIFVEKLSLYEMDPAKISGLDKAIQNAEAVAGEIFA
ncbi:ParA family protein [Gluconobacter kondonii]|uniref:ParA family protein n=1 Tax=Gluconobacter kondonii TaxID=941463 RepID=UPI001B8D3490|nr:ParA family protein [Gluconobacter kondonii]MBS1055103.1 ParA family protein [Gluconobacter kondonii]